MNAQINIINQTLDKNLTIILNYYNKIQLSNYTIETINQCKQMIQSGNNLLMNLNSYVKKLNTSLTKCKEFYEDIENDLSVEKKEDYVYSSVKGMLSYKERKRPIKKKSEYENITIPYLKYKIKVHRVNNLNDLPLMIHYYNNPLDKIHTPGLYCALAPSVYVKIPFPKVTDSTKEHGRIRSIKCKYITKEVCDRQRKKIAEYYNSAIRECHYVHQGEHIVKVGYPSRCFNLPRFGDTDQLINDMPLINKSDIRNILLYGLNDIMSAMIWIDYKKIINTIYADLDIAI